MRYPKKARLLAAAVAALTLVVAAGIVFSPEARSARSSRGSLVDVSPDEIESVEILDSDQGMTFRRFGGTWVQETGSGNLPARAERVESFLETVRAVRILEEEARSASVWQSLGLDDASSRRVRLRDRDGREVADFRFGRYSPDGSGVFLRKGDDSRSYTVVSAAASRLPSGPKSWLDLRVFGEPVPVEDVQRLRVSGRLRYPEGDEYTADFVLTRSASRGWTSAEIPDLDPSAAERFVRAVLNAEAEDFRRDAYIPSDRGGLRLDLELGGGTLRTLRIDGQPDAQGGFPASVTGTGRVLAVGSWTLKNLLKTPGELRYRKDL